MVSTAKTLRTPTTTLPPIALAANATGRIVKSGDAATPKGTAIVASLLASVRCEGDGSAPGVASCS